ncbi:MAG TPA: sigma-70 family RNA polymerase sigma factor [Chitinophagaceae bacterium]|nr:sigma-70 family RNA polymerase sigma factor [Chitinophagaceae bacterium]
MVQGSTYNESELLIQVASGEQKAFTILVDYYWNKVYSHALAYSKSVTRAQEITQDIFLKVWHKREALTEVRDFKSYLFILGKHHIISSMRKKLESLTGEDLLETREDILIPDQQLEYKETWNRVLEGIEKLPAVRKVIFKKSRFEGLSYEEIATSRNISKNTVKEHIVLALNFLRTYVYSNKDYPVILIAFILLL